MESRGRVKWIDIARGISITLVIIIHSCTSAIRVYSDWAYLLYTFSITSSIPILFFLSGCSMTLNRDKYIAMSFADFIKKKIIGILIPYFSYTVLVYLVFEFANFIPQIGSLVRAAGYGHMDLGAFIYGVIVGHNYFSIHVWFLYSLFFIEILTYVFWKYIRNDYIFLITALMLYGMYYLFPFTKAIGVISIPRNCIFFAMGTFWVNKCFKGYAVAIATIIWLFVFWAYVYYNMGSYDEFNLLRMVIPFMAIVVIPSISRQLLNLKKLEWIGQKSMVIFMFHQPFCGSALGTVLYVILHFSAWASVLICIIASLTVPLLIRLFFVRFRWARVLFGIR